MTKQNMPLFSVAVTLLLLSVGCATAPPVETVKDTRLDRVVSQLDQSLVNQTSVNAQLQAQQRQLEIQGRNLAELNQNLDKVFSDPKPAECPEVAACPSVPDSSGKMVVGGLEEVWFPDLGLALTARIDTGAATASLDAREIEQFERDGKPWVRFTIVNPKTGTPETLERRLVRTIGINQSGAAEATRRPVVKMGIVIGQVEQTAEFGLSNRSHMDYQVVIGRSILKDVMVVDVSKKNVAPYVLPDKAPEAAGAAQ